VSTFSADGFTLVRDVLAPRRRDELSNLTLSLSKAKPGTRCLLEHSWCQELAVQMRESEALRLVIPQEFRAIQCTFFEKTLTNNWLVPVHQDLSVPVANRLPLPGWGPWTQKEGTTFVQPPVQVLEELVAVRLHLDPCAANDGPLVVVPRTHGQGVIAPNRAIELRANEQVCTANAGDAVVFHTRQWSRLAQCCLTPR
jgi:Phytanoyl-CoA dioxygenase (PhyH)